MRPTLAIVLSAALVVSTVPVVPRVAAAQVPPHAGPSADEARAHFERGLRLYEGGDYDGALAEFQASYARAARPSVLYNLGITWQALHHYPEAARSLEDYLRLAPNLAPARRATVAQALGELRALIAHVQLVVAPRATSTVVLDGQALPAGSLDEPLAVGPGRHTIEATAPGHEPARESFVIASGETRNVTLALPLQRRGAAPPPANTQPAAPAAASPTALLLVVPPGGAVELDGHPETSAGPVAVAPGAHRLTAQAPGAERWEGVVEATPGATRTVRVGVAEGSGLGAGYLVAAASATGALLAASAVFGALTASTHADFAQHLRTDPAAADLATRGERYRTATNVLLAAAGAAGVAVVVLATQTRFGPAARTTADVAFAPMPGGGAARLRVDF